MNEVFSKRFKELREEKNKTQQELIDEFNKKYHYNFKKSAISMYENSKRMPEIQALTDFADYFGVSTDFLLGVSDIRNPYEIKTIAAHHDGDEFTEEELQEIENFKEYVKMRKQQKR